MAQYKPNLYFWEIIEYINSICFSSVMFILPGSTIQICVAIFVTFVYLLLFVHFFPYRNISANRTRLITLLLQFGLLFFSLVILEFPGIINSIWYGSVLVAIHSILIVIQILLFIVFSMKNVRNEFSSKNLIMEDFVLYEMRL